MHVKHMDTVTKNQGPAQTSARSASLWPRREKTHRNSPPTREASCESISHILRLLLFTH